MVIYRVAAAHDVSDEVMHACAQLFSQHYGIWGQGGPKPGSRVKMSAAKLRSQYLFCPETCFLVTAAIDGVLVGHAFSVKFWYPSGPGFVSWITQLCVSSDHRSKGIGSALCRHSWHVSSTFACGLVSSHPHAVRALEKATCRPCNPKLIMEHADQLIAASGIPYMQGCTLSRSTDIDTGGCTVNTEFHVDHKEVNSLIPKQPNWHLGKLPEGHEFFAFTFGLALPSRRSERPQNSNEGRMLGTSGLAVADSV